MGGRRQNEQSEEKSEENKWSVRRITMNEVEKWCLRVNQRLRLSNQQIIEGILGVA